MNKRTLGKLLIGLPSALVLCLVVLRFLQLEADPPHIFGRLGASLVTDPYYYTYFARNAVLFGDWLPFDYDRYQVFMYSIISGASYLMFLLTGVSRLAANVTSLILNFGGIFLFVMSFHRKDQMILSVLCTLFLLINPTFFFWGRYPLLENGQIFLSGLTCFLFFRYGETRWGQFATGTAVVLTAVAGKFLGIVLVVPIAAMILYQYRRKAILPLTFILLGGLAAYAAYVLVFFQGSPGTYYHYLLEVGGAYGSPPGLGSISKFAQWLVSYFAQAYYSVYTGVTIFAAALGWVLFSLSAREKESGRNRMVIFAGFWIIAVILALAPQAYRPLRHGLVLFLPMSYLIAHLVFRLAGGDLVLTMRRATWHLASTFIAITIGFATVSVATTDYLEKHTFAVNHFWEILLASALMTAVLFWWLRRRSWRPGPRVRGILILILFVSIFCQGGYYLYRGFARPSHNFAQLNGEVEQILGQNAIITGNYAPAITFDTRIRGVFDYFGPVPGDPDFFDRYGVTHMVISSTIWSRDSSHYDLDQGPRLLFDKTLRVESFRLYRFNRPEYRMTEFDHAVDAYYDGDMSEARLRIEKVLARYPDNATAQLFRLYIIVSSRPMSEALREIESAAVENPRNRDVLWACVDLSWKIYEQQKGPAALSLLRNCLNRLHELDPEYTYSLQEFLNRHK